MQDLIEFNNKTWNLLLRSGLDGIYHKFNMDKVFIKDLEVETVIGIYDWEREVRQLISISLVMVFDLTKAAKSDKIEDSLNYKKKSKRIIKLAENLKSKLIENLAQKIADTILNEFPVSSIVVTVEKPGALRGSRSVGVTIKRP
ncbi:MAG: 7,8-dihydroneopterin aldolase [Gammaproteobacteria bacterium]|nr:MAG: 7,8-dihydroneopterin aldolase [Gammaproteobacteria bacterium]